MAKALLNALDNPEGELSILIVDDPQIAELNAEYLNREGPTNVISFPMGSGSFPNITPHLLGDVVISADTAFKEGKSGEIGLEERLKQLLIHGVLHLFDYDHEEPEEAVEMDKKSEELLLKLKQL